MPHFMITSTATLHGHIHGLMGLNIAVVELDWVCIVRSAVTEPTSTINYMLDGSMSHVYNWHTYNNHRLSNLIYATTHILTIHIHHHPLLLVTASNCEQGSATNTIQHREIAGHARVTARVTAGRCAVTRIPVVL